MWMALYSVFVITVDMRGRCRQKKCKNLVFVSIILMNINNVYFCVIIHNIV